MRLFWAAFWLQTKRLVRRPATQACLLLVPALALVLGLALPAASGEDPVLVGVLVPVDSPKAQGVWAALQGTNDEEMRFEKAQNLAQLEQMVGAGAWECGYVLPEDLDARTEAGRYNRLVTRYDSAGTTLWPLVDWAVAAALLDVCWPDIALEYLDESGVLPAENRAEVDALLSEMLDVHYVMDLDMRAVNARGPEAGAADTMTGASLVRGLVALVLFLFGCLCAARYAQDMAGGFFARMRPLASPAQLFFPAYAAAGVLGGVAGFLALLVGGLFFPGYFAGPLYEAGCLALYMLYLAAFSFFLSAEFTGRGVLVGVVPFLMVACLLFCPIVMNIGPFLPAGRVLGVLLPPTLYLRAAAGNAAALWQMPLAAAGYLGLGAMPLLLRRRLRRGAHI